MGYYIRALPHKKKPPHWKVQFVTYKKAATGTSKARKPKKEWDIQPDQWSALGFRPYMTLEQARIRQKQLNSQLELKHQEERRKILVDSKNVFEKKCIGYLPEIYKREFEHKYILGRMFQRRRINKIMSHWNAAQKIVLEIQLEPSDWFDEASRFYDYFYKFQYSFSYIRKILSLLNLWGFFLARKLGRPFFSIPTPRGYEKNRLIDAYFAKSSGRGKQSDPLTPSQLENIYGEMKLKYYNWLHLSVWLGLRPIEIDSLHDQEHFRLLTSSEGVQMLWIYQTKLVSIPPRFRWKLIPIFRPEQAKAIEIINGQLFERPRRKMIKTYFGEYTTLYGGRKGFTDLMLSLGQSLENISQWMGHSSIDRTWKHYKNKQIAHFSIPKG